MSSNLERDNFIRRAIKAGLRLSPDGRVIHPSGYHEPERSHAMKRGYWKTTLTLHKQTEVFTTARIVCWLTHGAPRSDFVVDHMNGNSRDDRPENLRWTTQSENLINITAGARERLRKHAREMKASKIRLLPARPRVQAPDSVAPGSKLSAIQVQQIRDLYRWVPQRIVAAHFNITQSHVSDIVNGRLWGHVPDVPMAALRPVPMMEVEEIIRSRGGRIAGAGGVFIVFAEPGGACDSPDPFVA